MLAKFQVKKLHFSEGKLRGTLSPLTAIPQDDKFPPKYKVVTADQYTMALENDVPISLNQSLL